jgi:regulator of nucleoside diphosphate kinase
MTVHEYDTLPRHEQPNITLTALDHERLTSLAHAAMGTMPQVASFLWDELERAHVLPEGCRAHKTVCMGSKVQFRDESTQSPQTVLLVYPREADIAVGKVSVLTPIGTALIGLAEGQSITWQTRTGVSKRLTVLTVEDPET